MKLTPEEWKYLYVLRNDLEDEEDRRAVRRLIRYAETLKRKVERLRALLEDD